MPPTPVSQGLQALLLQQKKEAERLRQQYQQTKNSEEQRWQKRQLWQQQQQQWQQQSLRQQQQGQRDLLRSYAKMGGSGTMTVQLMKMSGEWTKLPAKLQGALDKAARTGANGGELLRIQQKQQRDMLTNLLQKQQGQRLGAAQHQQSFVDSLTTAMRRAQLQLHTRHSGERLGLRQQERQDREGEREKQRKAKEDKRQQDQRTAFIASLPRHGIGMIHAATGIGNTLQKPFMSQEQQVQHIAQSFGQMGGPAGIVGEAVSALVEFKQMLDGTTAAVRRLQIVLPIHAVQEQKEGAVERYSAQTKFAVEQQANRRSGYTGALPGDPGLGAINETTLRGIALRQAAGKRGTFAGELAYREQQMRFGPQAAIDRAQAEAHAARQTLTDAKQQATSSGLHSGIAQARAARSKMRLMDLTMRSAPRKDIIAAGENTFKAEAEAAQAIQTHEEAINRLRQANVTAAEKDNALAQSKLHLLQAEQQLLAQKEQRQSHGAISIGRMTDAQRAQFGTAMKLLDRGMPLNRMPQHLRSMLERVAPEAIQKRYEQAGLGAKQYQEAQQRGLIDQGSLGKTREQMAEVQAQVQVTLSINEANFASQIANAIGQHLKQMISNIEAKFTIQQQQSATGQVLRNATGG